MRTQRINWLMSTSNALARLATTLRKQSEKCSGSVGDHDFYQGEALRAAADDCTDRAMRYRKEAEGLIKEHLGEDFLAASD